MVKNKNTTLIIIFTILIALINITWVCLNKSPPLWDQSLYLNSSEILFNTLQNKGLVDFYFAVQTTLGGIRAPLLNIAVFPFYFLFGVNNQSAIFFNISLLFVFSTYIYKLSSLLFNKKVGLYSVLISQTIPLIFNINRQFLTEYLLTTLVIVFLFYLIQSKEFTQRNSNIKLGIALGIGLLSKIYFPVIIIGPLLYTLIKRLKNQKINLKLLVNLIEFFVPALIIASGWYLSNLNNILKFGVDVAWGQTANNFGESNIFNFGYILNLYKKIITNGSIYYFLLFILLIYQNRKLHTFKKNLSATIFLISWILIPLTILTFAVTKDIRYAMPFFPSFGILIAFQYDKFINKYKNKTIKILTFILLFIIPLIIILYNSFFAAVSGCTKGQYFKDTTCQSYSGKPDPNNWYIQEIVHYVNQKMPNRIIDVPNFCFIAIEHRSTNLLAYRYYNRLENSSSPVDFTSVWAHQSNLDDFINELNKSKPKCVIFPTISDQNDLINFYQDEKYKKIYQMFQNNQFNYSLDKAYYIDQNNKIEIYWVNK